MRPFEKLVQHWGGVIDRLRRSDPARCCICGLVEVEDGDHCADEAGELPAFFLSESLLCAD